MQCAESTCRIFPFRRLLARRAVRVANATARCYRVPCVDVPGVPASHDADRHDALDARKGEIAQNHDARENALSQQHVTSNPKW